MIRYALKCQQDHRFESWFRSAEAYNGLRAEGNVSCPVCGSSVIEKALMAPAVANAEPESRPLAAPQSDMEQALAELRRQVEANSEYVGMNFAAEARAMHEGEVTKRSIYGEARPEEARKLLEDGVPVAPLPFMPPRRTN